MKSNKLYPIVKEFAGKKCILKFSDGDIITAIVGEVALKAGSSENEVTLWYENNTIKRISLMQIVALREA